jgi:hypothetical protein
MSINVEGSCTDIEQMSEQKRNEQIRSIQKEMMSAYYVQYIIFA